MEDVMPFKLSKEQRDIQKAAKEFAENQFLFEVAFDHDLSQRFPWEIWKKACHFGFIGIHFPETFGGQGYGTFENVLVTEQFCRIDSGLSGALSFSDFGSEVVLRFGDEEQKRRFLTPIAHGKVTSSGTLAESEKEDPGKVAPVAKKEGNFYIVNGKKDFFINGL
jgi:acyl-CoA dehydrogenase